jgi:hypothetical protein
MLSKLPFAFPDRLKEFQQLLGECQRALAKEEVDLGQVTVQIGNLENLIQNHLLPLSEDSLPQEHRQKWLSVKTEVQRTARLLSTEFVFWRSARSPERRHHYQTRLLGHYQQLMDFARVMEQWLGNN